MPLQIATGRTTFAGIDPDYGVDDNDDVDDDFDDDDVNVDYDDMAPLVASSTMSPLELEDRRRQPTFPTMSRVVSWWGIRVFFLLLGVLLVPVPFHGHKKGGGGSHTNNDGSVVIVNSEHEQEPSAPPSIRKPVLVDPHDPNQETSAPTAMTTMTRPATTTTTGPTMIVAQDDETAMTLEAAEQAPVVAGCETEQSFNRLIFEMEEMEQFAPELCGIPKAVRTFFTLTLRENGDPPAIDRVLQFVGSKKIAGHAFREI
jgi:hypothetical protein